MRGLYTKAILSSKLVKVLSWFRERERETERDRERQRETDRQRETERESEEKHKEVETLDMTISVLEEKRKKLQ